MNDVEFPREYELFIHNAFSDLQGNAKLEKALQDKREFGLKKYGEISLQSSLENAMNVDTLQHAREELIDYMNYTLHEMFKNSRTGDFRKVFQARERFRVALELYKDTK